MFNWFRKYVWYPYDAVGTAGFTFADRIINGDAILTGEIAKIHGHSCKICMTTTRACVYWEKGDPVWPVYYAVGDGEVYYDNKTVGKFWKYIASKPPEPIIEDILSYYETPD